MQMGQVTSSVGRSQSEGGRPWLATADEDEAAAGAEAEAAEEEEACAPVAGGGLADEITPSSWSLSRSMGAAADPKWLRRACGGRRGESPVRSTTGLLPCDILVV